MHEKNDKRNLFKVLVLVLALVVLGISTTYAYYTAVLTNPEDDGDVLQAGNLDITTTLTSTASAINVNKLMLINDDEKKDKAQKVEFSITSGDSSTVDATYKILLKELQLSKNLKSADFKWELVKKGTENTETQIAHGDFSSVTFTTEETDEHKLVSANDLELTKENGQTLTKKTTDNLIFRIWLQNNPNVNQINLTNGSFSGKLFIEAVPVSAHQNTD